MHPGEFLIPVFKGQLRQPTRAKGVMCHARQTCSVNWAKFMCTVRRTRRFYVNLATTSAQLAVLQGSIIIGIHDRGLSHDTKDHRLAMDAAVVVDRCEWNQTPTLAFKCADQRMVRHAAPVLNAALTSFDLLSLCPCLRSTVHQPPVSSSIGGVCHRQLVTSAAAEGM